MLGTHACGLPSITDILVQCILVALYMSAPPLEPSILTAPHAFPRSIFAPLVYNGRSIFDVFLPMIKVESSSVDMTVHMHDSEPD